MCSRENRLEDALKSYKPEGIDYDLGQLPFKSWSSFSYLKMQRMIFTWHRVVKFYRDNVSRAPNTVWWESGWFLLSFLLIMLSFLLLCAKYSSNAVITVISIFTVVLLYYLNFLRMSDTLATISFSSQKNPMRREIRVGIIILSIDKEMEAQGACDWSRLVSDRISSIA